MTEGNNTEELKFSTGVGQDTLTKHLQGILTLAQSIQTALTLGDGAKVAVSQLKGIKSVLQEIHELSRFEITLKGAGKTTAGNNYGEIQAIVADLKALRSQMGLQSQLAKQSINELQVKAFTGGLKHKDFNLNNAEERRSVKLGLEQRSAIQTLTSKEKDILARITRTDAATLEQKKAQLLELKVTGQEALNDRLRLKRLGQIGKLSVGSDIRANAGNELALKAMLSGLTGAKFNTNLTEAGQRRVDKQTEEINRLLELLRNKAIQADPVRSAKQAIQQVQDQNLVRNLPTRLDNAQLGSDRLNAKVAAEQEKILAITNQRYHTEEKIKALQPEQIKHARDTLNYQYQTAGADVARREEASRLLRLLGDVETMHRKALSTNALIADLEKTHYKTKSSLQNLNREELQQAVKVLDYRTKIAATEQQRAAAQSLLNTANQSLKLNPEAQAEHREASRTRVLGDAGASLLTIQAGLMLNYRLLGGFQSLFGSAISSAIELDSAFRQLQAISAATNYEMATMKVNLIEVAQASKFSAAEVGNTAVLLAQAGLSIQEIGASMKGIITLAQATGTDLAKSVDVVTSVLSVFNKSAGETDQIVNQLTQALNSSKLDIQKMALGIQYAGNISADAGVSFEELTSALGAMANAGIRSGSTLGTGMRQIIIDLERPSKKLKDRMSELGLSLDDVDFKSQGLVGVLKNLREAGFTSADAFKTFEVRSAAAFSALSGNLDDFEALKTELIDTNAAFEANLVQMDSLAVQIDHLKSNLGILAATGLQPVTALTRDFTKATAHALETTGEGAPLLKVFTTAIAGLVTAVTIGWMAKLTVEIAGMVRATVGATSAVGALRLAFLALNPVSVGVYAGLGLVAAATYSYSKELDRLNEKLDTAKGKYNEQKEALNTAKDAYQNVDTAMKHLSDKFGTLSQDNAALRAEAEKLQEQFGKWGLVVDDFADLTLPKLMTRLGELRTELAQAYELTLGKKLQTAMDLLKAKGEAAAEFNKQSEASQGFLRGQAAGLRGKSSSVFSGDRKLPDFGLGENKGDTLRRQLGVGGIESTDSKLMAAMLAQLNDKLLVAQSTGKEITPKNFNLAGERNRITSSEAYFSRKVRTKVVNDFLDNLEKIVEAYNLPLKEGRDRANLVRSNNRELYASKSNTLALNTPEAYVYKAKASETAFNLFKAAQKEVKDSSKEGNAKALETYTTNVGQYAQVNREALKKPISDLKGRVKTHRDALQKLDPEADAKQFDLVKNEMDSRQRELDILTASSSSYDDDISTYLEGKNKAKLKALTALLESEKRKYSGIQKRYLKTDYAGEEASIGGELKSQFEVVFGIHKQIAELDKDSEGALANYQRDRTTALTAQSDIIAEKQEAIKTYLAKKAQEADSFDSAQTLDKYKEAQNEWFKNRELDDELWTKSQKSELAQIQARTERALSANVMFSGVNKDLATRAQMIANKTGLTQTYSQYGTGAGGFFANQAAKKRAEGLKLKFQQEKLARGLVNEEAYTQKIEEETPKVLELKERKAKAITVIEGLFDRQKAGKEDQKSLQALMDNAQKELSTIDSLYDAHLSFLNQAKAAKARASEQTQEALSYLKETVFSPQEELMKSVRAGQEAMTSGLSSIFGDWATQTIKNIDDVEAAFKSMGLSILQSMLKVVSDRTAMAFTNMLLGNPSANGGQGNGLGLVGTFGSWIGSLFGGTSSNVAGVPLGSVASSLASTTFGSLIDQGAGVPIGTNSVLRRANGGMVKGYAGGGYVGGTGIGRDSVPAMLMPNEYVLKPSATSALGKPFLDRLNATTTGSLKQLDGKAQAPQVNVQGSPPVNVYVVSPDQSNQMGPNDVVITVEDNISRNGSIKQLIKQVISGES